jgi:apolipoprotein N-acyltransferase
MLRPALGLVVGAALYALAFPPFDWSVCAWVALVPLLLVVRGRSPWAGFGWGAAYGYCCTCFLGASWLVPALDRFFDVPAPVGFLIASLYSAVFWGTAFGLFGAGAALLSEEPDVAARLGVAGLWVGTELLRGRLLGQPWGLLGYSQHGHLALIQIATITGVYGVSFLVVFVNVVLADCATSVTCESGRLVTLKLLLPLLLVVPLYLGGAVVARRGPVGGFGARRISIVQADVAPARDWTRAFTDRQILAHVAATREIPAEQRPALVIWPENAVPRYLEAEPMLAAQLAALASERRSDLLFGAPRFEAGRTYNSVRLIRASGEDGGAYDKRHLVLLAERRPFARDQDAAPASNPKQFGIGSGPTTLRSFLPLGLSICHEILFPEDIARSVADGAAILVNVSNDGWLDGGKGVAGAQHFAMAVFRTIETRRYLVRATTTGVSGVIDPYGRIVETLPPRRAGTLTTAVAGRAEITPYVRFGDMFAVGCVLGACFALARHRERTSAASLASGPISAVVRRSPSPAQAR